MNTVRRPDLSSIKHELKEIALVHAVVIGILFVILVTRAAVLVCAS